MCNLFSVQMGANEMARHFGITGTIYLAAPPETIRGGDGLVVRETQAPRAAVARLGFPRRTREMRDRGDPPTRVNLTAGLTNPMWSEVAQEPRYRCLILLTRLAAQQR